MIRNYLTIALRNLRRNKGYTAINIGGLAVGMACCLLIMLYVQEELSYDDFHEKADRIVAIGSAFSYRGQTDRSLHAPYPLATALEAEAPEVVEAVRVNDINTLRLSRDGETFFKVEEGLFAEPSFFDVFSFDLLRGGSPEAVLAEPNSIVLTQTVARRIFSGEDPIGQTLYWQQRDTTFVLEVTGVAADPPSNTSLPFGALVSLRTVPADQRDPSRWYGFSYQIFVVLEQKEDIRTLPERLSAIAAAHLGTKGGPTIELFAAPLTRLHLSDLISTGGGFIGTWRYIYLFSAIALIILLIACINYTNLATARASQRAKEVGVRKTAGATRLQLARQFLGESVLLALGALILAVLLAEAALPAFNGTFGTHLNLAYGENAFFLGALVGLVLVVGLAAGSYPALYLSAFKPARVLKGRTRRGHSGAWLRKSLVVVQFTLSMALLISTFVIYHQLQYVQTKDLGFNGEQVVAIELPVGYTWGLFEALRRDALTYPGIMEATIASAVPGQLGYRLSTMVKRISSEAQVDPERFITLVPSTVDYHFIETLGLHLIAGRGFSREHVSDEQGVILNEAAAQALGWTPGEAIGKPFALGGSEGDVIGVVEDFHIESLHKEIVPVVLQLHSAEDPLPWVMLVARLAPGVTREAMDHIEQAMAGYAPDYPFDYQFLDDLFDAMYRTEQRLGRVFVAVAAVAVLLACLGLFGLAAYAAEQRTKEIGIRKVLGASVPNIVILLSKDFLKLVGIAIIIATPIAYFAMNRWLQDFAYRIDLDVGVFLLAGLIAVVIAFLTVSYQSIKAALANPVDSLRYE